MFAPAGKSYPDDILSLTSLRFFAAMSIVVFHFTHLFEFFEIGRGIAGKTYLAVDFFFILSGFILAHSYIPAIEHGNFKKRDFYIKRLARIYPVHLFTLVWSALGIWLSYREGAVIDARETGSCFVSSLFLVHAWDPAPDLCFNRLSWSISAEWFAYLLFPFLAVPFLRWKPEILLPASALFFGAVYVAYPLVFAQDLTGATSDFGILRIFPEFIAGMALYLFGRKYRLPLGGWYAVPLIVLMIAVLAHLDAPDGLIVPFLALLIAAAAERERRGKDSLLKHRLMVHLGEISYSIYMVHLLVLEGLVTPLIARDTEGNVIFDWFFYAVWLFAVAAVILISHICYSTIEKPARNRINAAFIKKKSA